MNTQRFTALFFLTATLLLAVRCQRAKPKPPAAVGFDSAITSTTSYVAGPITFELADLERKINRELGTTLVADRPIRTKGNRVWQLRVERRGPVRLRYVKEKVLLQAALTVDVDVERNRQKRRRKPLVHGALAVNLQTPLTVTDNWRLGTRTSLMGHEWIEKPRLRLLGFEIPITRIVDTLLENRRLQIEGMIDTAVRRELRLDREIQRIWRGIQKPLLIAKRPDSLWLIPKPVVVAVGDIRGDDSTITLPIRVGFHTDTRLGPRPAVQFSEQLPRLRKFHYVREVSDLKMLSFLSYADLNRVLERELKNRDLSLAGGMVNIKGAAVYGGQRSLIVKTDVGGAVNGTLYFRGQPVFDTVSYTFKVKNLDFDVQTEEFLLSSADWLLHDHLRDTLQAVLNVPLQRQILQLPQKIDVAFERGKAGRKTDLEIETFRFVPQRIAIRPDGIQTLIRVESKVGLAVTKL